MLGSKLKKNLLFVGVSYSWYRHRERDYAVYHIAGETLDYCSDSDGLMIQVSLQYSVFKWRLFIDSSQSSLKAVLLHNGNELESLPLAHSVNLKENHKDLALMLQKIKYEEHGWIICDDFKILRYSWVSS